MQCFSIFPEQRIPVEKTTTLWFRISARKRLFVKSAIFLSTFSVSVLSIGNGLGLWVPKHTPPSMQTAKVVEHFGAVQIDNRSTQINILHDADGGLVAQEATLKEIGSSYDLSSESSAERVRHEESPFEDLYISEIDRDWVSSSYAQFQSEAVDSNAATDELSVIGLINQVGAQDGIVVRSWECRSSYCVGEIESPPEIMKIDNLIFHVVGSLGWTGSQDRIIPAGQSQRGANLYLVFLSRKGLELVK